jgi:acyl carrier protein
MGRWKRTFRNRRRGGPGLEEAERHYRGLPHIEEIALAPCHGAGRGEEGLFAVIVPDARELTASKVMSARQRIGELLDAAGARLPETLRVRDFILYGPAQPRAANHRLSRYEAARLTRKIMQRSQCGGIGPNEEVPHSAHKNPVGRLTARLAGLAKLRGPFLPSQELERDLGLDSLDMLELRMVLEEEFGVSVPDSEFWRLRTVGDVLDRLENCAAQRDARADTSWGRIIAQAPRPLGGREFQPERKVLHWLLFRAMKALAWVVTKLCFGVEVEGRERLPLNGPVVIAPNHVGYLDPLFIYAALPARLIGRTHFIAFAEILSKPHLAWLARFSRLILTGNAETTVDSLRRARAALASGEAVCIFPEGSRSPSSLLMPPRPGAGILSAETQAPILPVYIEGGARVTSPRFPGLHFPKVRLVIGDPIVPPGAPFSNSSGTFERADFQAIVERWRDAILRLENSAKRKEARPR